MSEAAHADAPPEILVSSGNPGKLREIRAILADLPLRFCALDRFPAICFPEEGAEYEPNAIAKAQVAAGESGLIAVADDSGLEVEALSWGPGPLSARFGGPGLDDRGRLKALLDAIRDVPETRRRARFVCVAAMATPAGEVVVVRGECAGHMLEAPVGEGGFGYDPAFRPDGYDASMGQLSVEIKNHISHRARAFRALAAALARAASAFPGQEGQSGDQ